MAVKRLLQLRPQYDDGNGALASGYRLFFYAAGSSTKQNTYNSSTGLNANTNPIVLNALGEPGVEVWGTVGQIYKIGLAIAGTDDPPASFVWTEDNISPINDTTVTLDEWVSGPAPTYVSATQFTLTGDQTTAFHIGRRVKCTVTAGTAYGTITASAFGALTTITVDTTGSNPLDSGLSAVSYGLLSAANFAQSIGFDVAARQSADIVSAATLNLDAAGGDLVDVTGTTAITAITLARGKTRTIRFTGALTFTNGASLVLPGGANITTAAGDFAIVRGYAAGVVRCVSYIKASGLPPRATQPTRQVFLTGSGTYTTPANCSRINVRLVGGGGSGATSGANGGDTTFSTLTGSGGKGAGALGVAGGDGGVATGGDINIPGGGGQSANQNASASVLLAGANGGNSAFGGGGKGGAVSGGGGAAGATNSGSGGGSDGVGSATNGRPAGGAGGYVEKLILAPAATYSYGVGAGGAAGTGGAAGAAGIVIVDEWYD